MNNSLVNIENMSPALREAMQTELKQSEKVSAGIGTGSALPKLSIAGKEFSVRIGGQSQPLRTFTLDVIIADSRANISKQYYEKAYDPSQTAAQPDCASIDGKTPDFVPTIIDKVTGKCPHNCAECYFNQFGTATQGKGKACKDYKRLVVLLAGTEQNPFDPKRPPLTLDLPATSFHAPKDKAGVMMFREFIDTCTRNNMPPSMVVAELSFMSGTAFSQLCMRPKRLVTDEEYNRVLEVRGLDDVKAALNDKYERHEEDLPEETKEALAEPVKEPAKPVETNVEEKQEDFAFLSATPPAQENAVTSEAPAVEEKPVEVSAEEAEAVKQLDDFFKSL